MNTTQARTLLAEAAHLIELTATFQAAYGKDYHLKPGSPEDAWTLHDQIYELECRIASLLDEQALEHAYPPHGEWWERYDVMPTAIARELLASIGHLITCCARASTDNAEWSYAMQTVQQRIAGMLRPASHQVALNNQLEATAI